MKVHTIGVRIDFGMAVSLIIRSGFFGLYILPVCLSRTAVVPFISRQTMAFTLWRMIFRNLLNRSNRFILDMDSFGGIRIAELVLYCVV